jgi:hypothetical protein
VSPKPGTEETITLIEEEKMKEIILVDRQIKIREEEIYIKLLICTIETEE